jgi:hypothetical protein
VIKKGSIDVLRERGIELFRQRLHDGLPWLGDRIELLESLDDIRLLNVMLSRLRRWYRRSRNQPRCPGRGGGRPDSCRTAAGWAGIDYKSPQGSATTLVTDSPHAGNSATRASRRYTGQHCRGRSRGEADDCPGPAQAYATLATVTGDSWLLRGDRLATRTCTRLRKTSLGFEIGRVGETGRDRCDDRWSRRGSRTSLPWR